MPEIAFIGSKDSRNDTKNQGSATVFANGLGVVRLGDRDTRNDAMVEASSTVYANSKISQIISGSLLRSECSSSPSHKGLSGGIRNSALPFFSRMIHTLGY